MKTVYVLQSKSTPDHWCVRLTADFGSGLDHNSVQSPHTSKFQPERLVVNDRKFAVRML